MLSLITKKPARTSRRFLGLCKNIAIQLQTVLSAGYLSSVETLYFTGFESYTRSKTKKLVEPVNVKLLLSSEKAISPMVA